jgi:hypothetical protein
MAENFEAWLGAGAISWPCAGVEIHELGELELKLLFSDVVGGPDRDLVLRFGRVIAMTSYEESAIPGWTNRTTSPR